MNEGFFSRKETESLSRLDGKLLTCASCGLYKLCKSPKMKPVGEFKKKIMIIGDAPNEADDKAGMPWQGKDGRLLQQACRKLKVDIFRDCISMNATSCRPMGQDKGISIPSNYEIECCRRFVIQAINEYKPALILLLGQAAAFSVIGHRWKRNFGKIDKWRGWTIPDTDFNTWICPTYAPNLIDRVKAIELETIWTQDLQRAFSLVNTPLPEYKKPEIVTIEDLSILKDIPNVHVAIDYETTGIKPHAEGHRIVCASVAISPDFAYVFMMPQSKKERQPFIDLLASDRPKIAANMKFEEHWSVVKLRQSVNNWQWDTMLTAHLLDNRPDISGLKFQAYVNFGVVDYSSEIDPWLHSDNTSGNAMNKILQLIESKQGKQNLLHYCGLDAIYEYRLAMKQMNLINPDDLPF